MSRGSRVIKNVTARKAAQAAYSAVNNGQRAPSDEALLPYFATPQEAADYVEFMAKQKGTTGK